MEAASSSGTLAQIYKTARPTFTEALTFSYFRFVAFGNYKIALMQICEGAMWVASHS